MLNSSYSAKQGTIQCFDQEDKRYPEKECKKVFSLFFIGPNSPRPAFGSPGPPKIFKAKGLARLGELTALGLSFSSPGRAATAPRWPFAYK